MAKIILVASGKGGTGKTSLCTYTTLSLAKLNKKVLLIDADCGFKGLDLTLGISNKIVFNFLDVFKGDIKISDALVKYNDNLHLLSAPLKGIPNDFKVSHAARLIASVYDNYDFIFIDCSSGFSYETEIFSKVCHAGILVSTPDTTSVRGAENMASRLESLGLTNLFLVLNRLRPKLVVNGLSKNIDEAIDETALPLLGIIPEDENVISASNLGVELTSLKKQKASIAYQNIANRLLGKHVNIMNL